MEQQQEASQPQDHAFHDLGFVHSTILYLSEARTPLCDVEALAQHAAERNALEGITGLLCFDGLHFLQYIEGPQGEVNDLYQRLLLDSRHMTVETLMRAQSSDMLRFPTWSMAFVDCQAERAIIASLRGSTSGGALNAFEAMLTRVTSATYRRQ